jgi:hypothetical protein
MALTTQQILDEIKLLVPPSTDITDDMILRRVNQVQRKVFRELPLPDKVYRFSSTPGYPYYDLPSDCTEDRIKNALVDGQDYKKVSNEENTPPLMFCTVILNKLYLYPNPSSVVDVFLYYRPRYKDLSTSNLSQVPDLPEDYHELLVFGGAQWVASTQRDVDMVNNMQAEYDDLLQEAKRYFKQFTPKRVRIAESW